MLDEYDYELDEYEIGVIYHDMRDLPKREESFYFSPDGIGRIWFDSLEEAQGETGFDKVIELDGKQERREG